MTKSGPSDIAISPRCTAESNDTVIRNQESHMKIHLVKIVCSKVEFVEEAKFLITDTLLFYGGTQPHSSPHKKVYVRLRILHIVKLSCNKVKSKSYK